MHVLMPSCLHSFLGPLLHMEIISPIEAFGHYLVQYVPHLYVTSRFGAEDQVRSTFPVSYPPYHPLTCLSQCSLKAFKDNAHFWIPH